MIKQRIKHRVIDQLSEYRQSLARIKVLSSYSVGAGITISRLNEDDHLQELHRKLRGRPSYMYLSKREQKLETAAHTHLTEYPSAQGRSLLLFQNWALIRRRMSCCRSFVRKFRKS